MDLPSTTVERQIVTVPSVQDLTAGSGSDLLHCRGFAAPEPRGTWSIGHEAVISFSLDPDYAQDVLLNLELSGFVDAVRLPKQVVEVRVDGEPLGIWTIARDGWNERPLILPLAKRAPSGDVSVEFSIPTCRSPAELGISTDPRRLGIAIRRLTFTPIPNASEARGAATGVKLELGRLVGPESRATYDEKVRSGFWARYLTGPRVLDIGCKGKEGTGLPVIDGAIGVDIDYPGYDGRKLPFPNESQDAVYASHVLEHIPDFTKAIQEWHRVTKIGGYIIVAVPHAHLYERRHRPPSNWNGHHVRVYTAASLLAEFQSALAPNSYRVRHLLEDDRRYRYEDPPEVHPTGRYEIELVVQKIKLPEWVVSD